MTTQVITRFPPEPNGFLHIGHLKAMIYDFETHPNCFCYLRMDDTNPDAERQEFVDAIIEDVEWLGFKPHKLTYTSDYFDKLYEFAVDLIKAEKAYVDLTKPDKLKEMRYNGEESRYRTNSIEWHLTEFENMRKGKYDEEEAVLRLKIDMHNNNHTLRDPIAYRIKYSPHHRSKDKWCIYPSYDYSHGIIDSLENITHSYCTTEYFVRREQYYWPVNELIKLGHKLVPAYVHEFGKLVVENTVLSKRNILALVDDQKVSGFDDPRLMTIRGLRRRGFTPNILKEIVKNNTSMEKHETLLSEDLINHYLRKTLDITSDRMFAVIDPIKLSVVDLKDNISCLHFNKPKDPNDYHYTQLTKNLYIDKSDFRNQDSPDYYRLAPNKTVRLRFGPFIKYIKHDANYIESEITNPENPKKIKGIIHWVSKEDSAGAIFEIYTSLLKDNKLNEKSKHVYNGYVEKTVMLDLTKTYQFERVGFFKFDRYENNIPVFIRVIDLVDKFN
jgi:glutaminyl-tRNA synthetase